MPCEWGVHIGLSKIEIASFAQIASVVSMAVSALVLVGWAFDIDVPKRVVPELERVKPNTAIGFILLGVALIARDGVGALEYFFCEDRHI